MARSYAPLETALARSLADGHMIRLANGAYQLTRQGHYAARRRRGLPPKCPDCSGPDCTERRCRNSL